MKIWKKVWTTMMKKSEFLKNDNDDDVMQCSGIQHYKLKFLCIGDDKHAAIQGKAVLLWRYVNQPKKAWFSYECAGHCSESQFKKFNGICYSCWTESKKIGKHHILGFMKIR